MLYIPVGVEYKAWKSAPVVVWGSLFTYRQTDKQTDRHRYQYQRCQDFCQLCVDYTVTGYPCQLIVIHTFIMSSDETSTSIPDKSQLKKEVDV